MVSGLSQRRQEILAFIYTYTHQNGRPPTVRDIQRSLGMSSTSQVKYHLDRLTRDGYIARSPASSRGLRLLEKGLDRLQEMGIALVEQSPFGSYVMRIPIAGYIVAGEPVAAYPTNDADVDTVDLTRDLIRDVENVYALRVRGDSMVDASVHDGDLVILRQTQTAENGDMVAVWLEDSEETTLKYFYREGRNVRLQPANPAYEPIIKPANVVRIQGKVITIIRHLN